MKTLFLDLKKACEFFLWLRKARKTPYSPDTKPSKELDQLLQMFRRNSFRQTFGSGQPYQSIDSLLEKLYG